MVNIVGGYFPSGPDAENLSFSIQNFSVNLLGFRNFALGNWISQNFIDHLGYGQISPRSIHRKFSPLKKNGILAVDKTTQNLAGLVLVPWYGQGSEVLDQKFQIHFDIPFSQSRVLKLEDGIIVFTDRTAYVFHGHLGDRIAQNFG